jgi:hypothetical protein
LSASPSPIVEIDVRKRLSEPFAFFPNGPVDGRFLGREKPIKHPQARRRQQISGAINDRRSASVRWSSSLGKLARLGEGSEARPPAARCHEGKSIE